MCGSGRAFEVFLCGLPDVEAGESAERPTLLVSALEVDAAVPAGHAGLVGHRIERLPGQHDGLGWGDARLDLRAAGREGHLGVEVVRAEELVDHGATRDRKSTRLNFSHMSISYAVFC